MIKVKDGYAKLIGTTYQGSSTNVLLSNGGNFPIHSGRNNEANKLVRTDSNGQLHTGWINTTSGDLGGAITRIYCSNDSYIRYQTPANFFSSLTNSGNNISITVAGQNRTLQVGYASNSGYTGITWTSNTKVGSYSKLCRISGYANVLLSVNLSQNSQASNHLFLISTGYSTANIIQLGANNYSGNSSAKIRVTSSDAVHFDVEILNSYGYNGAEYLGVGCKAIKCDNDCSITTYTSYTAGSGTVEKEITSSYNSIVANLTGNATTATKWQTTRTISLTGAIAGSASIDGSGNININTTYATGNISNLDNRYVNITGDTMTGDLGIRNGRSSIDGSVPYCGSSGINSKDLTELANYKTVLGAYTDKSRTWYSLISVRHRNGQADGNSYGLYLRSVLTNPGNLMWGKQYGSSRWQAERVILDSANYTSYTVTKTGSGASGTWGIGISGNAATASKLTTTNAGSSTRPVYFSNGIPVGGAYSFGNGNGNAPVNNGTVCTNLNADMLDGVHLLQKGSRSGVLRSWARGSFTTVNQYFGNGAVVVIDPAPTDSSELWANTSIFSIGDIATRNWQMAFGYGSDTIKVRRIWDGPTYGNWKQLAFIDSNVASATKLATSRTINGTSFNGTANIVTSYWGTARTIYIQDASGAHGSVGVSVNGSTNYNLKLPSTITATLVGNASSATNADTLDGQHASAFSYKSWWHWSGQSGQPSWIWGGNSENNYYVYNPSNFSVNYAKSAGNADKLDGYHASSVFTQNGRIGSYNIDTIDLFGSRDIQPESEISIGGHRPFNSWGTLLMFKSLQGSSRLQLAFTGQEEPYIRYSYGTSSSITANWKRLAFLSSNVASASKLGTSTVGGTAKPIYLNGGTPVALSSTKGSTSLPVYLNAGTITTCTPSSLFSNLSNSGTKLSISVAGQNRTLTVMYSTSTQYVVSSGNQTALSGNKAANSGIRLYEAYNNGYPISFGNLLSMKGRGSTELLMGWKSGANRMYYRSNSDINEGWTSWQTVATLADISNTVKTGTTGHLAYYSSTSSVSSYNSNVGNSYTPIYLSSGVPKACNGVVITQFADYDIYCNSSNASFIKAQGNFSPVQSVTRISAGLVRIQFSVNPNQFKIILVPMSTRDNGFKQRYVTDYAGYDDGSGKVNTIVVGVSDDYSRNDGSFHMYIFNFL